MRPHWSGSPRLWALLTLISLSLTATPSSAALQQSPHRIAPQKRVLALYSVGRDSQLAMIGDRDLPRVLRSSLTGGVDYYAEYLDWNDFAIRTIKMTATMSS